MVKQREITIEKSPAKASVPLYRFVFTATFSSILTMCLIGSFLLQPIKVSAAEEDETLSDLQITDELIERVQETEALPLPDESLEEVSLNSDSDVVEEVTTEDVDDLPSALEENVSLVTPETESTREYQSNDDTMTPAEDTSDDAGASIVEDSSETASTSLDEPTEEIPVDDEVLPENNEIPSEETVAEIATTTEIAEVLETATTTEEATTTESAIPFLTVESDQMIQFDKTDCVAVADGSFYCQPKEEAPAVTTDGLFSLPDADGDLEIFMQKEGQMTQITHNFVDDAAPQYDAASDSLVWHRMVDDRYQIIIYDVSSGDETQLTNTRSNNMSPYRFDNYVAWQYWSNDAWQIMLFDGDEVIQLTNTSEHNIAPAIRNGLVVWHRVAGANSQTIEVYDLSSKTYMTIDDTDGGSVSNPRMVLVFESTLPTGDVVTKGYDLATGEVTSFAATPAELPEEIPDPETTGETRALIQNKTSHEDEIENLNGNEPVGAGNGSTTPAIANSSASSSSETVISDSNIATTTPVVSGLTIDLREAPASVLKQALESDLILPTFSEIEASSTISSE